MVINVMIRNIGNKYYLAFPYLCKHAKGLGVPVIINPDAHSLRGLADISYGVMAARKGWLEANDVLNTLTAEQLSAMI